MRIAESWVCMRARHDFSRTVEESSNISIRAARRQETANQAPAASNGSIPSSRTISADGVDEVRCCQDKESPDLVKLKILVEKLVEMATGKRINIRITGDALGEPVRIEDQAGIRGQGSTPPVAASRGEIGWSIEYDYERYVHEEENAYFGASGFIRTADGKEIAFKLDLSMRREFEQYSIIHLRAGNAATSDPLVIDFDGTAAQLSEALFEFDLDADGKTESLPMLMPGKGYLALDLDGNGIIDNGRELFGPTSGDGFAELSAYDADGNGWIDEADPVFNKLIVWVNSRGQDALVPLNAANIGALYLGWVCTPFSLTGEGNRLLGSIRSTGIYLREDGTPGAIRQIDLCL